MNQKEYNEILFHKLKENIGNVVTCISYDHGIKKETNGVLREVCDQYYISIGSDSHLTDVIPFIGSGVAILTIFNEQELLYLNNRIEDGYNITDYNEIGKLRKEKFGCVDEGEILNYSFNELKNLYTLVNTLRYNDMISFTDKENRLCLIKDEDVWNVYINTNGNMDYFHSFDNITEACLYAITIMCDGTLLQKEWICKFANNLRKEYSKEELSDFIKNRIDKEKQYTLKK